MKKKLLKPDKVALACLIFPLLLVCHAASAQNFISIGPSMSSATETFPKNGRVGLGASAEYTGYLFKNGSIRLYAGYDHFAHNFPKLDPVLLQDTIKFLGFSGYAISLIPIRAGYQQYLFKDAGFMYAEAGISHLLTQYKGPAPFNSSNLFTFAAGAGYRFAFKQSQVVQLSLFYNYNKLNRYRNLNYISLRAAYGLRFGKVKIKELKR